MIRTFRNYARSFGAAVAIGAAALGLSWFLDSAEPTVIKRYTENGREVTLFDYDGNLSTVEERVTRGRFPAFGSEPPFGGYTEKKEFEPPVERDGKKVNTEVSFYDPSGRRVEGPIRTLEPREGGLETPEEKQEAAEEPAYLAEIRSYFEVIERLTETGVVDDVSHLYHYVSNQKHFPDVKDMDIEVDQIPSFYPVGLFGSRSSYVVFKYRNSSTTQEAGLPEEVEITVSTSDTIKPKNEVSFSLLIGGKKLVSFSDGFDINDNRYKTVFIATDTIQTSSFDIDGEDLICKNSSNDFDLRGEKIPIGTRIDGSKVLRAVEHFGEQATKVEDMFYASLARKVRDYVVRKNNRNFSPEYYMDSFEDGYILLSVHTTSGVLLLQDRRGIFDTDELHGKPTYLEGGRKMIIEGKTVNKNDGMTQFNRDGTVTFTPIKKPLVAPDNDVDGRITGVDEKVEGDHILNMNTEQYRKLLLELDEKIGDE